jgi:hypothetical protein
VDSASRYSWQKADRADDGYGFNFRSLDGGSGSFTLRTGSDPDRQTSWAYISDAQGNERRFLPNENGKQVIKDFNLEVSMGPKIIPDAQIMAELIATGQSWANLGLDVLDNLNPVESRNSLQIWVDDNVLRPVNAWATNQDSVYRRGEEANDRYYAQHPVFDAISTPFRWARDISYGGASLLFHAPGAVGGVVFHPSETFTGVVRRVATGIDAVATNRIDPQKWWRATSARDMRMGFGSGVVGVFGPLALSRLRGVGPVAAERGVGSGGKISGLAGDIESHLGPGFTKIESPTGNPIFRSADGTKQIRFDLKDFHSDPKGPHINLETWVPRNKYPGDVKMRQTGNIHIYPEGPK